MQRDKCTLVAVHMIPTKFMGNYELHKLLHNGHSYAEFRNGMFGMPQTVKITQYNRVNI